MEDVVSQALEVAAIEAHAQAAEAATEQAVAESQEMAAEAQAEAAAAAAETAVAVAEIQAERDVRVAELTTSHGSHEFEALLSRIEALERELAAHKHPELMERLARIEARARPEQGEVKKIHVQKPFEKPRPKKPAAVVNGGMYFGR